MSKAFTRESDDADDDTDAATPALPSAARNYMTPGGWRRLRAELIELLDIERPKLVETVAWAAKNGDRSENGDYLYGKKRLREIDRRIRFLTRRLDVAEVVDPSAQGAQQAAVSQAAGTAATSNAQSAASQALTNTPQALQALATPVQPPLTGGEAISTGDLANGVTNLMSSSFSPMGAAAISSFAADMAVGYKRENGRYESGSFEFIGNFGPAGSLTSTATDMARFMIAHLQLGRFGDQRILEEATARRMHGLLHTSDPRLPGMAYGFYQSDYRGERVIGHGGDTLYFHTDLALFPEHDVGLFVSYVANGGFARWELVDAFVDVLRRWRATCDALPSNDLEPHRPRPDLVELSLIYFPDGDGATVSGPGFLYGTPITPVSGALSHAELVEAAIGFLAVGKA